MLQVQGNHGATGCRRRGGSVHLAGHQGVLMWLPGVPAWLPGNAHLSLEAAKVQVGSMMPESPHIFGGCQGVVPHLQRLLGSPGVSLEASRETLCITEGCWGVVLYHWRLLGNPYMSRSSWFCCSPVCSYLGCKAAHGFSFGHPQCVSLMKSFLTFHSGQPSSLYIIYMPFSVPTWQTLMPTFLPSLLAQQLLGGLTASPPYSINFSISHCLESQALPNLALLSP